MSAPLQPLEPPRLLELFQAVPHLPRDQTAIELSALAQPKSSPAPQIRADSPAAADPPAVAARSTPVRFFDSFFHDHSHPHQNNHNADDDLPGYRDPAVAPILAAVKGGISKAAPFAFLNYLLLLTILYEAPYFYFHARMFAFVYSLDAFNMYGASYMSAFNSGNTRVVFCDHDGGAEADALFSSFLAVATFKPCRRAATACSACWCAAWC